MMRIGELARRVGVSTDTVRFYERSGLLPRPARRENDYREYGEADAEHLRLLIDLRRLDLPLEDAARIASWCHSGHCADTSAALPALIATRRAEIASRIAGLQSLDARLADLERHLAAASPPRPRAGPQRERALPMAAAPCCDAADAVLGTAESTCACCTPALA
ncbi:MAG: MerR family transcriptional regulator [Chloroflexi bacterium]|nr:MerR family transcriptional regulator [Chloroflexota bacterium]